MSSVENVIENHWILRLLLSDFPYPQFVNTAGGIIVLTLMATCIGISAQGLLKLKDTYDYGESLKASCNGDYMIVETGQEQVVEQSAEFRKDIYIIIAIFISVFVITYVEFNRWFIALNLNSFIHTFNTTSSLRAMGLLVVGVLLCVIAPIIFFSMLLVSYTKAMNAAKGSDKSYNASTSIEFNYGAGVVGGLVILWVILQTLISQKSDLKLVYLASLIVTLITFQYIYFPNLTNIVDTINDYNKNAQVVDDALAKDMTANETALRYYEQKYLEYNNEITTSNPDNLHKYALATAKVISASPDTATYDPSLLKFSSTAAVDAFNAITTDTVGPKVVSISNQMRYLLFFAVVVCIFPVFHTYYKINAPSASMAVLVLTGVAIAVAMVLKIYYSNLPTPSATSNNIKVTDTSASSGREDSSGSFWSDIMSGITSASGVMQQIVKNNNPPQPSPTSTATSTSDAVNNIRHTWAQMKADTSIKQAVDSFHTSMQAFVMIPILIIFGAGFHVSYKGAQYETITASIAVIVALIVFSTNYAAYSNYK